MHHRSNLDALINSVLEEANQREEDWHLILNDIKETDIVCKEGSSEEQRTRGIGKDGWEQGSRLARYGITVQVIYDKQSQAKHSRMRPKHTTTCDSYIVTKTPWLICIRWEKIFLR